jgi:hypothetical protein
MRELLRRPTGPRRPSGKYIWVDKRTADLVFIGKNEPLWNGYLDRAAGYYWWENRVSTIDELVNKVDRYVKRHKPDNLTVLVVDHGSPGAFGLDKWYDKEDAVSLGTYKNNFDKLVDGCRGRVSHLIISACNVSKDGVGRQFLETLARQAQMMVTAPNARVNYCNWWKAQFLIYQDENGHYLKDYTGHYMDNFVRDRQRGRVEGGYLTVAPDGQWSCD